MFINANSLHAEEEERKTPSPSDILVSNIPSSSSQSPEIKPSAHRRAPRNSNRSRINGVSTLTSLTSQEPIALKLESGVDNSKTSRLGLESRVRGMRDRETEETTGVDVDLLAAGDSDMECEGGAILVDLEDCGILRGGLDGGRSVDLSTFSNPEVSAVSVDAGVLEVGARADGHGCEGG